MSSYAMIRAICDIRSGTETKKDAQKYNWPTYFEACPRRWDKVYDVNNEVYLVVVGVEHRSSRCQSHIGNDYRSSDPHLVIVLGGLLMPADT